jgi:hypothetical protein
VCPRISPSVTVRLQLLLHPQRLQHRQRLLFAFPLGLHRERLDDNMDDDELGPDEFAPYSESITFRLAAFLPFHVLGVRSFPDQVLNAEQ